MSEFRTTLADSIRGLHGKVDDVQGKVTQLTVDQAKTSINLEHMKQKIEDFCMKSDKTEARVTVLDLALAKFSAYSWMGGKVGTAITAVLVSLVSTGLLYYFKFKGAR